MTDQGERRSDPNPLTSLARSVEPFDPVDLAAIAGGCNSCPRTFRLPAFANTVATLNPTEGKPLLFMRVSLRLVCGERARGAHLEGTQSVSRAGAERRECTEVYRDHAGARPRVGV